jgi:hypothetical protein
MMLTQYVAAALEIMDEVRQSNPMNSLDDYCDPDQLHSFQSLGRV